MYRITPYEPLPTPSHCRFGLQHGDWEGACLVCCRTGSSGKVRLQVSIRAAEGHFPCVSDGDGMMVTPMRQLDPAAGVQVENKPGRVRVV